MSIFTLSITLLQYASQQLILMCTHQKCQLNGKYYYQTLCIIHFENITSLESRLLKKTPGFEARALCTLTLNIRRMYIAT